MNLAYSREWLTIANRALNLVGETAIQDFTGSGEPTQNIVTQLPSAVQQVLSYYPFRCARKRSTLAPVLDTPVFEFKYAYQLPTDFVSLVKVSGVEEYQLEGDTILSDDVELQIVYAAVPATPKALTPLIQEAITLLLAYKIAKISTMNEGLANRLFQEYQLIVAEAKKNDDQGIRENLDGDNWWTEER